MATKLTSPSAIRQLLARYGLQAEKRFGQNFLIDPSALEAVLAAAALEAQHTVLEVGPGLGVLTRELAARAGRVVAVELDRRMLEVLDETLADVSNVTLIAGDALRFDFASLPQGALLVANLPYNIATPLIVRALTSTRLARLVVMVQREVAERLCAQPGTPAYGALSLVVRHFGRARKVRDVPPAAFFPPPKVVSSIVRLEVDPAAQPNPALFDFIHSGFRHRRKTLRKNLQLAGYAPAAIEAALAELKLPLAVRAEALELATFTALWRRLTG